MYRAHAQPYGPTLAATPVRCVKGDTLYLLSPWEKRLTKVEALKDAASFKGL